FHNAGRPAASSTRRRRRSRSGSSSSQDLDRHAPFPSRTEFYQEDALPPTEFQLTIDNGHRLAGGKEKMLTVGVAVDRLARGHVGGAGKMVIFVDPLTGRGDPVEEAPEVSQQEPFVFVDPNRRSRMHRVHMREAAAYAGRAHDGGHVIGNVQELS